MRIAVVVRILWSAGTQKFAIEQTKALSDKGYNVELIFIRRGKNGNVYDNMLKDLNYRVLYESNRSILVAIFDFITGIFMKNRKGEGRVDYNLIKLFPSIVKERYDLIICQDQWAGLAGYYTYKKFGTPYFVIIHERINNMPWVKGVYRILALLALRYQKKILLSARKVLALTKDVAITVEEFYSKYHLKVVKDFPGINSEEFVPFSEKTDTIVLVSYWNEVKFPELYFHVFKNISDFKFIMIGNWISEAYKNEYIEKLAENNLISRVKLITSLSEYEKNDIISSSKYYLRFGQGEYGPGYGSIEALKLGVPLIVNRELGIANEIKGYKVGLVVDDPKDTNRILEFINKNNNAELYNELQENIRRFNNEHSWKRHCEILLEGKDRFIKEDEHT